MIYTFFAAALVVALPVGSGWHRSNNLLLMDGYTRYDR